jgi:hypothetical protein
MADESQEQSKQAQTAANSDKNSRVPENLREHTWKPGQSGNPNGRPKAMPITDAYRKWGSKPALEVNPRMVEALRSKGFEVDDDATFADVAALAQWVEASKGKTPAISEIADRMEGKAIQRIEHTGADQGPI